MRQAEHKGRHKSLARVSATSMAGDTEVMGAARDEDVANFGETRVSEAAMTAFAKELLECGRSTRTGAQLAGKALQMSAEAYLSTFVPREDTLGGGRMGPHADANAEIWEVVTKLVAALCSNEGEGYRRSQERTVLAGRAPDDCVWEIGHDALDRMLGAACGLAASKERWQVWRVSENGSAAVECAVVMAQNGEAWRLRQGKPERQKGAGGGGDARRRVWGEQRGLDQPLHYHVRQTVLPDAGSRDDAVRAGCLGG